MSHEERTDRLMSQIPWGKLVLLWIAVFAAAGLVSYLARDQMSALGGAFYAQHGLVGLAIMVLLIDTYTPGFPFETIVFLALAAGGDWMELALVAGSASSLAGALGYGHGALLDRWLGVHQRVAGKPWMAKLRRFGAAFVAFGALTPFPYSAINWSAGALRLPFWHCFAASWVRLARTLLFTYLMHLGWSLF